MHSYVSSVFGWHLSFLNLQSLHNSNTVNSLQFEMDIEKNNNILDKTEDRQHESALKTSNEENTHRKKFQVSKDML